MYLRNCTGKVHVWRTSSIRAWLYCTVNRYTFPCEVHPVGTYNSDKALYSEHPGGTCYVVVVAYFKNKIHSGIVVNCIYFFVRACNVHTYGKVTVVLYVYTRQQKVNLQTNLRIMRIVIATDVQSFWVCSTAPLFGFHCFHIPDRLH